MKQSSQININILCEESVIFVENHLDLTLPGKKFNPREAFGSHDDADHVYNTPRAWYIERFLNPKTAKWDGDDADYTPTSDDIPWSMVPERKITVEDIKYLLSSHYNGTKYDPYGSYGEKNMRGAFRSIGINRTILLRLSKSAKKCQQTASQFSGWHSPQMLSMLLHRFTRISKKLHDICLTFREVFQPKVFTGAPA